MPIGSNEEWGRADDACARGGMDAVLLSSLADVTYISGFEVPIPIGAGSEFAYGIPLALCTVPAMFFCSKVMCTWLMA